MIPFALRVFIIIASVFPVMLFGMPSAAYATKVKRVNLEEIVKGADRIFAATCVAVEDTTLGDTRIPITRYTFSVSEGLKGGVGDTVVVRHLGVRKPRPQGNKVLVFRVPGMPVYRVGQEVVLFLVAESVVGLSSPVGLSQGAFTVVERQGRKVLLNGNQNAGLLRGLAPASHATRWRLSLKEESLLSADRGSIDYETFLGVVRKILSQP